MTDSKQPPHSIDAEQAVLGALLERNDLYDRVVDHIADSDFYRFDHQQIYRAISRLIDAVKPADVITVAELLAADVAKIGGIQYLHELVKNTPSAVNIGSYAKTVRDRRIARDLMTAAVRMDELAHGHGEINERLDAAQSLIATLHEGSLNDDPVLVQNVLSRVVLSIDARYHSHREITGLSTGFIDLDTLTAGLQKADLILIAGRPSMGKSALAMQIAQQNGLAGKAVLVFSLEMRDEALVERMIANHGCIDSHAIRTGQLRDEDWPRLTRAVGSLRDMRVLIDQSACPTLAQMRAKARRVKRQYGLDLIIVDYIQLMHGDGDNREQQVSSISRGLKALAKELDVPVVALSQLSRECDKRKDQRPQLADLRESGSLEQDADLVMFVFREAVYRPGVAEGVAEILIRKQRMGRTGDVFLTWSGEFCRFDNHAGHYQRSTNVTALKQPQFDG